MKQHLLLGLAVAAVIVAAVFLSQGQPTGKAVQLEEKDLACCSCAKGAKSFATITTERACGLLERTPGIVCKTLPVSDEQCQSIGGT